MDVSWGFFSISDELWGTGTVAIMLGKKEQNCLLDLFLLLPFLVIGKGIIMYYVCVCEVYHSVSHVDAQHVG